MKRRDYSRLMADMSEEYARHSPQSAVLHERAKRYIPDGASHGARLVDPFPPRIVGASGSSVFDVDGHTILDFWQGHFANVLGHNPQNVAVPLAETLGAGYGLQTGFMEAAEVDAAEILCRRTGAELARFTTGGTLATMYALMLACGHTGRGMIMKVGGGWHGAQPFGLKGISYDAQTAAFDRLESTGLSADLLGSIVVTGFNDVDRLHDDFRRHGDRLAAFIVEPFIGAGGCVPARPEYLRSARELADRYGTVLIFDEIISGFRFRAGDAGSLYGVRPDLATFGKIIGGGMPVSAVAGRAEIMRQASSESGGRVRFHGGTYSAHPAAMLAAKLQMEYLTAHEGEIYPRLIQLGNLARQTVEGAFAREGIVARFSGYSNGILPDSSLNMLLFPYEEPDHRLDRPEETRNPALCDVALSEVALRLAMLLEDVHTIHGLGALSTAHTEDDIERLGQAYRRAARRIKPYL